MQAVFMLRHIYTTFHKNLLSIFSKSYRLMATSLKDALLRSLILVYICKISRKADKYHYWIREKEWNL